MSRRETPATEAQEEYEQSPELQELLSEAKKSPSVKRPATVAVELKKVRKWRREVARLRDLRGGGRDSDQAEYEWQQHAKHIEDVLNDLVGPES